MYLDLTDFLKESGGILEINEKVEVPPQDGQADIEGPADVELQLINTGENILADGKIKFRAKMTCSRCLKEFTMAFTADMDEQFSCTGPDENAPAKEKELSESDFVFQITDNKLDLTELVREYLILNMPIKALCSQDCKGPAEISEVKKKRIDPRLEKLKEAL